MGVSYLRKKSLATWKLRWHHIGNALATPLLGKPSDAPIWRVFFFLKKFPLFQRLRYTKRALSYDEQLSLLEFRGLVVLDRTEALRWLSCVSYYRFSAYLYNYRIPDKDAYRPGTNFTDIVNIYNGDRELRLHLMDAIERIEVWFRCAMTYELAHQSGPFGYLRRSISSDKVGHKQFCKNLRQEHRRSKETFVEHYRQKYIGENHLPIWMATEILSFGTMSRLYSGLPLDSKKRIAACVDLKDNVLINWLETITYIRNLCAHHSRVWNRKLAISPKLLKGGHTRGVEAGKLYSALVALDHLISKISPTSTWGARTAEFFQKHPVLDTRQMGFPSDWLERLPFGIPR